MQKYIRIHLVVIQGFEFPVYQKKIIWIKIFYDFKIQ